MKIRTTVLAIGLASFFALSGCTTNATTHRADGGGVDVDVASDGACHGVLNCTFDLVETAVMYPFRMLASIF